MNASSYVPLVGLVAFCILFVFIGQHYRRRVNRAFALYLVTMAVWAFGSFMLHANFFDHDTPLWNKLLIATAFWSPIVYFRFMRIYLNEAGGKSLVRTGYLLGVILTGVTFSGDMVVRDAYVKGGIYYGEFTPLLYAMGFVSALFLFMAIWILVRSYRRTRDRATRNRLTYLFGGFGIVMGASITNLIPTLASYPIDQAANVVNGSLITYAIVKHRLLDISFVIRKGMVYSSITVVITSLYLLLVFALQRAFQAVTGYTALIAAVVAAVTIAVLFQPLRDICQQWVDRLFYREDYNHRSMLKDATQVMIDILDLNELSSRTVELISSTMKIKDCCLLVLSGNRYVCLPHAKVGFERLHPREIVFKADNPIIQHLVISGDALETDDIDRLHQLHSLWKRERGLIDKLGAILFIPLKARQQLVGVLILGSKLSEEPYIPDEVELVLTVANQLAIAIDNARLYEESKHSYEELKSAQERIVQSERLKALGEMTSGIAHDFNNALTGILGNAQLALRRVDDEKVTRSLKTIEQAAYDAAGMVRRLQDFARIRADHALDVVDLNTLIEDALEMIKPRLDEQRETRDARIELILELGEIGGVEGDAGELRETLLNMLINSIEAMPNGGKLVISSRQDNDSLVISISDTGVGMSKDVMKRVFDPLFTTKGTQGLGMGLSVVYGAIRRHGGQVSVSSKVRKGSTFTIKLPASEREKTKVVELQPSPTSEREADILVVDDDESCRQILCEMLVAAGYRVDVASTGREGLSLAKHKDYDLLLADLGMPDISGLDLVAEVRTNSPKTRAALVTGWGVQVDPIDLQERGVENVIKKPFTEEEILTVVGQLLDKRAHPK